jgi:hypothetical protein
VTTGTVLRRTAEAFRSSEITWGRKWFHDPTTGCRCLLGGIAYAVDADYLDSDPRFVSRPAEAMAVVDFLAQHLVDEGLVPAAVDEGVLDSIETVAEWSDAPERTVEEVITRLELAAEIADRTPAPA